MLVQNDSNALDLRSLLSPNGAYRPLRDTRELLARVIAVVFSVGALGAAVYATTQGKWSLAAIGLFAVLAAGTALALAPIGNDLPNLKMLGLFWIGVGAVLTATYAFHTTGLLLLMLMPMMFVAYLYWDDTLVLCIHLGAASLAFCLPFITGGTSGAQAMLIVTLPTFLAVTAIAGVLADRFRRLRTIERSRFKATIEALSTALTARDGYTGSHSLQTLALVRAVCEDLDLSEHAIEYVCDVALLHDIGKIGIPNEVLNAPGKLDIDQWTVMKQHPEIGERIVATVPGLEDVARAIRHEHEHWDGSGYPDGLQQGSIPLASRIVLVCDAYHAMTSDRPYRGAMNDAQARLELSRHAGTQFDPVVVGALLRVLDIHPPRRATAEAAPAEFAAVPAG